MGRPTIGIDASRAIGRIRTGTENYSAQIIRGLIAEPAPNSWRLYFNGSGDQFLTAVPNSVEIRDIPSARLWTHLRLSRELLTHRIDGLFVPAHVVPAYHPATVVTIHDLGYLHRPEMHPRSQRMMLDLTTRWSAKAARHIIVPSTQTLEDLTRFYRVPDSKITVVPHGVDSRMSPNRGEADDTLGSRYGLNRNFVLAVGTIQPRKNLGVLARAMKLLRETTDLDLVIAGRKGWMHEQVLSEINAVGLGDRLNVLDYVPDSDLPALYRAARVFVQPSLFEGFGMPVLEAMACGTPVIVAESSSLAEVGGNAAMTFDPQDAQQLATMIGRLNQDGDLRSSLIASGLERTHAFSWEQSVRKTRIVLEDYLLN